MSAPLNYCQISAAARGDEQAYQELLSRIIYNLTSPAYYIIGCMCNPSCPEPNETQKKNLDARIQKDIAEYRAKRNL